ncbi:MAG: hypothetical protein QG632_422 [Candidatus Dependentiae bacterium]|nr:hypothetical protein [Candidatus Dependentiae bacterium]
MYFIIFFLLFLTPSLSPTNTSSPQDLTFKIKVSATKNQEGLPWARDKYLASLYAPISYYAEQIFDALALTNKSAMQRKFLRLFSLGSKAISATAHGAYALSTPFFDNPEFADSYLKRPVHALNAWGALRRMPKVMALLANDAAFAKKLQRLPAHVVKEISRARIKNAIIKMLITFSLIYICNKITKNQDARLVYSSLMGSILHKFLIDKSTSYPRLETAVLKEIEKDKEREDAVNVRDIISEIKMASAGGGKK